MLTSRERLLAALRRQPTDRVPISTYELCGFNSRSFENTDPSYTPLMDFIRARTDCVCMWDPASNAILPKTDHVSDILETSASPIEMDVERLRQGNLVITRRTLHTPKGDLTCTTKVMDDVQTIWKTEHWCKSLADVEKLLSIPYLPVDYNFADLERVRAEMGDKGIVMSSIFDPLGWTFDLMEMSQALLWTMTETEHFVRTLEQIHERTMENVRRMMRVQVVDLYRICGPEYATPPYMPSELFQRFVVPYVTKMVDLVHSHGALARLHSHGKIGQVLDMILATGADALDPCEEPPDGDITLAEVKRRAGHQLCLFGPLQLKLLEAGTPEQVEAKVIECLQQAKAGGGYVIMPTASPINSPLSPKTAANYRRFIETALKYGFYD